MAADPRIDALREKRIVTENPRFTADYVDADKRFIGNAVQINFTDASYTAPVLIDYPIGHRRRCAKGIPVLLEGFSDAIAGRLSAARIARIRALAAHTAGRDETLVL